MELTPEMWAAVTAFIGVFVASFVKTGLRWLAAYVKSTPTLWDDRVYEAVRDGVQEAFADKDWEDQKNDNIAKQNAEYKAKQILRETDPGVVTAPMMEKE